MSETRDYSSFIQQKGDAYKQSQIVSWSHYNDRFDITEARLAGNSRIWGDASAEVQTRIIDILIDESRKFGLSDHQTAYVLAIARIESGFNPDAAAGTTSAFGLGQFTNATGSAYGLNDNNRWDARAQALALIEHFKHNSWLAEKRGKGEEYIYKYHHDGPNGEYGGLEYAQKRIMPFIHKFEDFVKSYPHSAEKVTPFEFRLPVNESLFNALDLLNNFERGYLDNGKECSVQENVGMLFTLATFATQPIRKDPLVLDLDSDGLETIGINASKPILFDHDADGINTASGWINADDAFLVIDKNVNGKIDNGRELFGDAYIKKNCQMATDGFDALKDLDSNSDGKIDSNDADFASLSLWRDLNQDGVSQTNELFTLISQNIAVINVDSIKHSQILANGNQLADLGSFSKTDGTRGTLGDIRGKLGDINLVQNTFIRQFANQIDTSSVDGLPDIKGSGQVRNLHEAASLSPLLSDLITDFVTATTRKAQQALVESILKAWSETSSMATTFSGAYIGHKLSVNGLPMLGTPDRQILENRISILERFNGRTFNAVPSENTSAIVNFWSTTIDLLNRSYDVLKTSVYQSLILQIRVQPLLELITLKVTDNQFSFDFTKLTNEIDRRIAANPTNGIADLAEFTIMTKDILKDTGWDGWNSIVNNINTYPITEEMRNELLFIGVRFNGTNNDDIVIGDDGNNLISGDTGNDIIYAGN